MTSVLYTLYSHDHRLLPTQIELARKYLMPDRIVVVQGPLGDNPMLSAGTAWVNEEAANRLGVQTIDVPDTVVGMMGLVRQRKAWELITQAIRSQSEPFAWVLEGDVLPLKPLSPQEALCGHAVAGRIAGSHYTWLCTTGPMPDGDNAHSWRGRACTRDWWPDIGPMPSDYHDAVHWEWCAPAFLHADKISHGLGGKVAMLEELLGKPLAPGPLAASVPHVKPKRMLRKSLVPVGLAGHGSPVFGRGDFVGGPKVLAAPVERRPSENDGSRTTNAPSNDSSHITPPQESGREPSQSYSTPAEKQVPQKRYANPQVAGYANTTEDSGTPLSEQAQIANSLPRKKGVSLSDAELERRKSICRGCKHLAHLKDSPVAYCKPKCPRREGKLCEAKGIAKYQKAMLDPVPWCKPWKPAPTLYVAGYPHHVGGAGPDLWALMRAWRNEGIDVAVLESPRKNCDWVPRMEAIGVRFVPCEKWWEAPGIDGQPVAAFCNTVFARNAEKLKARGCKLIWSVCMTFLLAEETSHYAKHGTFTRHILNSRFQESRVRPQLEKLKAPPESIVHIPTPFWPDEWEFSPRPVEGEFVIGRLSRAAEDKYQKDLWGTYDAIRRTAPVPVRARVMAWDDKVQSWCGPPPEWAEVLKAKQEPAADFLHTLHCLVHKNGGAKENRPRVAMEAMSCGVPLVVENLAGWRELIEHGETGFLCDTREQFIEAVCSLAADEELRQRIVRNARAALPKIADNAAIGKAWRAMLEGL